MTLDALREICMALPDATEDVKWGQDLAFCVGKKMFCVVNTEPPHQVAFKCTPEDFGELTARTGLRPAPYLARAMWVQEEQLGEALDRGEMIRLVTQSYELVRAKLPKRATLPKKKRKTTKTKTPATTRAGASRRSRAVPARSRRRRR
jgi:predicted DNA-binding protein (MmcQ/YjbR family)